MAITDHEVAVLAISAIALILLSVLLMPVLLAAVGTRRRYHPVAGTVLRQIVNFNKLHHSLTELACKHKSFRLLAPFHNEIYTVDPAVVEYILKTNFQNYGKGQYSYQILKDLAGDGIFTVDGLKWRQQRNAASVEFSKRSLREYSNTVFRKNAAELVSLVSQSANSSSVMDIQNLFMKLTISSICQVAFGMEPDSMCSFKNEFLDFIVAMDAATSLTAWRFADISWKIKKLLNIGHETALKEKIRVIDDFVYKIIYYKIEEASRNSNNPLMKKGDILSRLLNERERDPENVTTKYLRDFVVNFIVAGKDTTAVALSWFIYMLCRHPSVEAKAFDDVISATEETCKSASINEFIQSLTDESFEKMQYLHAVLTETLRLYPPVPMDPKICFSDDTLPDGYNVKKGDVVGYLPYAMGRMKFLWGDDADAFRPERWLNDAGIFSPENPFKFTAFQAGPRICLGKEFAYRQMKIFAAVLLRFFRFELRDNIPVKYKVMLTLNIDKGLHVYARHR